MIGQLLPISDKRPKQGEADGASQIPLIVSYINDMPMFFVLAICKLYFGNMLKCSIFYCSPLIAQSSSLRPFNDNAIKGHRPKDNPTVSLPTPAHFGLHTLREGKGGIDCSLVIAEKKPLDNIYIISTDLFYYPVINLQLQQKMCFVCQQSRNNKKLSQGRHPIYPYHVGHEIICVV